MADTVNLGITQLTEGQSQKEVTINTGFEGFDKAIAGKLVKDIAGGVDVTLTTTEWQSTMLEFTGALTANISVIVPTTTRRFSAFNNTTGAFSLTLKTAAGTGMEVPQTERLLLEQTGAGVVFLGGGGSGGGEGATTLLALTDTPDTYTGQASKVLAVKTDETGTEFITPVGGGGESYWTRNAAGTPLSLATGLLAFWRMEEASGNRVDSVGGQALIPAGTTANITQQPGITGQAVKVSPDSHLTLADNATMSVGAGQSFTVACWVRFDVLDANDHGLMGKGNQGTAIQVEYFLRRRASGNVFSISSSNGSVSRTHDYTGLNPVINTWYLVIAWWDSVAGTMNLQVSNNTVVSVANTEGSQNTTHPFEVGRAPNYAGNYLNGRLDNPMFWKRTLTTQERTDLWNGGAGLDYAAIVASPASVRPTTSTDIVLAGTTVATATEPLESAGGIKVGNSSGTTDGTIRWTGTDFEGRKGGVWVSLTT